MCDPLLYCVMTNVLIHSSYYGDKGLQYNMLRVPVGGSDFSTHPYTYNEYPENDIKLTNFSLTSEDYEYKVVFCSLLIKRLFLFYLITHNRLQSSKIYLSRIYSFGLDCYPKYWYWENWPTLTRT